MNLKNHMKNAVNRARTYAKRAFLNSPFSNVVTLIETLCKCVPSKQQPNPELDPFEKVQALWQLGAAHNAKGHRKAAVETWASMMRLQQEYSKTIPTSSEVRHFLEPYWTAGFGHIALLDFFVKCKELGLYHQQFHLIATKKSIANNEYLSYWNHWFKINHTQRLLAKNEKLPSRQFPAIVDLQGEWLWIHQAMSRVEELWDAVEREPTIRISRRHKKEGWQYLRQMGMPRDSWFVTLHVREGGHVSGMTDTRGIRNADVRDYMSAIECVVEMGGWIVRIGDNTFTPLPNMRQVIDYAVSEKKNDALDVFFLSQARFVIATNSGPAWVAKTFGTPVVLTNWGPIGDLSHSRKTVTVPRLLWLDAESRHLRFEEQFNEPYGFIESQAVLSKHGLSSPPNQPNEIVQAVKALIALMENGWQAPSEDQKRQESFKRIAANAGVLFRGFISADFLTRYEPLLTGPTSLASGRP